MVPRKFEGKSKERKYERKIEGKKMKEHKNIFKFHIIFLFSTSN